MIGRGSHDGVVAYLTPRRLPMPYNDPATRVPNLNRHLMQPHLADNPEVRAKVIRDFMDVVVREERMICHDLAASFDREGIDDIQTSRQIAASIQRRGWDEETGYYQVIHLPETTGMETLRSVFDDGKPVNFGDNWLFLATSGVHGSYVNLDDIEEAAKRLTRTEGSCWDPSHEVTCVCGAPEDDDNHCHVRPDGRFRITALMVKPRVVQAAYGTIWGQVADGDIEFLRRVVGKTLQGVRGSQEGCKPPSLSSQGGFLADVPVPSGAVRNEANGPVAGAGVSLLDLPRRPLIPSPRDQSLANVRDINDDEFVAAVDEVIAAATPWAFVENPPDQSSSDDEWYSLNNGYIRPEEVLSDPAAVAKVEKARVTLASFFAALDEAGIRQEM